MAKKKFNFSSVKKRRNNIAAFLLESYLNVPLVGNMLQQITSELLDILPSTVVATAVFETVRVMAGTSMDRKKIQEFAWRVAGNVDKLVDGEPVIPWTRQLDDEIVPVRVELVTPSRRKNDFGFMFTCRALAGSPCPTTFSQFFSSRSCKALSRAVGFSNTPWGLHQYGGLGQHFTNLMFFAHIEAERSRDKPVFRTISVSSGMHRANKALIEVRCRTKPCPRGLPVSCVNCHFGYTDCSYAVHPKTFVEAHCNTCDKNAFFDPDAPGIMCINCQHKNNCSVS
jgi:hypothetical protein